MTRSGDFGRVESCESCDIVQPPPEARPAPCGAFVRGGCGRSGRGASAASDDTARGRWAGRRSTASSLMSTAPSFSGRVFPCGVGVRVVISSFFGEADRGGELQGLAVIMSSRQAACSSGDVGSIVMRSGGEAGSAVRGVQIRNEISVRTRSRTKNDVRLSYVT